MRKRSTTATALAVRGFDRGYLIGGMAVGLLIALALSSSMARAQDPTDAMPPAFTLPDPPPGSAGEAKPDSDPAEPPAVPQQRPNAHAPLETGPGAPSTADKDAAKGPAPPLTAEERTKQLAELYKALAAAPSPEIAEPIAKTIEQLWQISTSPTAELLVARAVAAADANRSDLAMKLLDAAIDLQPDFVEAWNRRAFLFYTQNEFKRALGDIRRVLALDPHQYKALEGMAHILKSIGEKKAALAAYDSLIAINPNMPGAKAARDELRLEVEGQGI